MKTFAFAAALLIGSAAIAQTTDTPAPPADPSAAGTMMPSPPTPPAPPATPDAMGANSGAMSGGSMAASSAAPAPMAQASYPRCSATVTDQCRQSSARESDTRGGMPAHHRHRRG